jgi:RHS repeat-associated protein
VYRLLFLFVAQRPGLTSSARGEYDKGGNLRYSQNANQAAAGQVYFTTYDFAGRASISGLGTATFSSLDPDGSPPALETTQANWLVVRAYDAKPSTTGFPWSSFSTQINALTLTNVVGRLAAVASKSNGAWQVTLFSYDGDGQVTTRYTYTQANGGASVLTAVNTTSSYTRDLRGAPTQRVLAVGSSSFYQWYDYDGRGLLWKLSASTTSTKPGTPDLTDTYRPSGMPASYQFLGGPLVPITYTIREQTAKIGDPASTTYPFSARYAYLPDGVVDTAEFYNQGSPAAQKRYRYAFGASRYDALNRLKGADFSSWSGSAWTTTAAYDLTGITYDADGNLTALQRYRDNATLIDNLTYSYPSSSNRLTSVTDAVATTPETWDAETGSFTYDANGNVKTAPAPYSITNVTYDAANLPLSITRSGTTTTYRYDDAGQRITKQVGTGNTEFYLREGGTTVGVFTVNGSGALVSWYSNLLWEARMVGRQPNTGNRDYYHFDILGSTRAVVQGASSVESHDYDPWGLEMPARGLGSGTKEAFGGKEQDLESGLDYFGARYYLPALGRWGAVDPQGEDTPEWTPYQYVFDDPALHTDPDGRQVEQRQCRVGETEEQVTTTYRNYWLDAVGCGVACRDKPVINESWNTFFVLTAIADGPALVRSGVRVLADVGATNADQAAVRGVTRHFGGAAAVEKGKEGVRLSESLAVQDGETVLGHEVTFDLPSGGSSKADLVTRDANDNIVVVESKNGPNTRLSPRQRELVQTVQGGGTVTPRGPNAAKIPGLKPGEPVRPKVRVDWHNRVVDRRN